MSDCSSEIKSPIKKLKEEAEESKDIVSSLVERIVKLKGIRKTSILTISRILQMLLVTIIIVGVPI